MAQAKTKELLVELGGEAQECEIIRLAIKKGFTEESCSYQGIVNRDLRNLERWGEIERLGRGRWKLLTS